MSINLGVPDEITEFEDSQKLFEKKSDEFLKLVMSAKHIVVFTGKNDLILLLFSFYSY